MEEEIIHEFFAVTKNSVYYVTDQKDEAGTPLIDTIRSIEERSKKYIGGDLIVITKHGIALHDKEFFPVSGYRRREQLQYLESGREFTSPIVGLFLREEDAIKCFFDSNNKHTCDPRWKKETLEVVEAIGDDHPVFVLSNKESITYES